MITRDFAFLAAALLSISPVCAQTSGTASVQNGVNGGAGGNSTLNTDQLGPFPNSSRLDNGTNVDLGVNRTGNGLVQQSGSFGDQVGGDATAGAGGTIGSSFGPNGTRIEGQAGTAGGAIGTSSGTTFGTGVGNSGTSIGTGAAGTGLGTSNAGSGVGTPATGSSGAVGN